MFLAVAGLVLVSLVEIDRSGVPSVSHHGYLPYTNKGRVAAPAPALDMTSQAVLAAQPEHQATMPAEARAARAEAPSKKARIEASAKKARAEATPPPKPGTQPTTYQQTPFFDRFSIKDY